MIRPTDPPTNTATPIAMIVPLSVAYIGIGGAVTFGNIPGFYNTTSMALLALSLMSVLAAVLLSHTFRDDPRSLRRSMTALYLCLGTAFVLGMIPPPVAYVEIDHYQLVRFAFFAVVAVLTATLLLDKPLLRQATFPVLILLYIAMCVWVIRVSYEPPIDVWYFQHDGVEALLHGHNPYSITYRNVYGEGTWVYGPGVVKDGRVLYGFPYPPLSLLLSVPGYLLGDPRYSQMLAVAIAALLIGYSRGSRISFAAAVMLLFTPRSSYIIEGAWTEPFAVLMLALIVWCAKRRPKWLPIALGLLIVTKQYLPVAAIVAILLFGRPIRWKEYCRTIVIAGIVGAVVSLPLALWDWHGFWHSVVEWQFKQPFRHDALTFLHVLFGPGGTPLAPVLAIAATGIAVGLSLWRAPRSVAGFALSVGFVCFCFFAFNKQAFANYYFFVIGALCCAIAALTEPSEAI
jgi:hypothetical protein